MKHSLTFSCTLLLLAATSALTAQTKTWSLGLSGGVSTPLGSYQDYNSRALGSVSTGGYVGLDLHYFLHKNISIGLSAAHLINPVDANKTAEGIWDENKTAADVHVTATPYQLTTVLLGISPQTGRLFGNLSLFAELSGGILVAQSPKFTQEIALSSPLHQTIKGAASQAFAVQGEAGLQYQLHPKLGLGVFASYLSAKPSFDFVRSDLANSPTESVEQHVQLVSVGLKLLYSIGREAADGAKR